MKSEIDTALLEILKQHVRESKEGCVISIKAKPSSSKACVELKSNALVIKVKSPPENNKANMEILKIFKKLFKSNVYILKGYSSNKKELFVENMRCADVISILLGAVQQRRL